MKILQILREQFGAEKVQIIKPQNENDYTLALVQLEADGRQIRILTTVGLSDYKMPVSDAFVGREYNEIYFCLPSYWDFENPENPKCNWVFNWIQRLAKFVVEKNTWFGHGHTIPAGNPPKQLSETMKQDYFIFSDPILLQNELKPIVLDDKTVHFLAIIPIFKKEWTYKSSRNTNIFIKKFIARKETELLDDYRKSILHRKFFNWLPI